MSLEQFDDDSLRSRFKELNESHDVSSDPVAAEMDEIVAILKDRRLTREAGGAIWADAEELRGKLATQQLLGDKEGANQTARTLLGILNGLRGAFDELREDAKNRRDRGPF